MASSPLELMYQLNREKRQEKQKAREQAQQKLANDNARIQARVDALRQSNTQSSKNLTSVGGAVTHGVISGISEALTENQLKHQQYKEYLDEMTNAIDEVEQELQQTQISQDWLKQNYGGLGSIVSYFPQLGSVRATRALTPYIDDLGRAVGQHADITDINTETGMVTIMTDKGELEQMNFYDLFPDIKSSLLMHQSVQQADGLYSNEQLMRQAQMEYEDEQRRLNRRENRDDRREQRENEKWEFQKRALEAERQQQEQQQHMQSYEENVTDDNGNPIIPTKNEQELYRVHLKQGEKRMPEIKEQLNKLHVDKTEVAGMYRSLNELKKLREEAEQDPELKDSQILNGRGDFSDKVRSMINDLPGLMNYVTSPKAREFVQKCMNASRKYIVPMMGKTARQMMGGVGVRNIYEFKNVQEVLPSLFGSKAGFDENLRASEKFCDTMVANIGTAQSNLKSEYNSYFQTEKEFVKGLRAKKLRKS